MPQYNLDIEKYYFFFDIKPVFDKIHLNNYINNERQMMRMALIKRQGLFIIRDYTVSVQVFGSSFPSHQRGNAYHDAPASTKTF